MPTDSTLVHRRPSKLGIKSRATFNKAHEKDEKDKDTGERPHYKAVHKQERVSILSPTANHKLPSFSGFQNLAMIVLVVNNIRLIVENYENYGFLKTIITLGVTQRDAITAALLTASVPVHLFAALAIERMAVRASSKPQQLWALIALLHAVNALLVLVITTYTVFYKMFNPLVGTICESHAIVVCMKVASYAFTNRDFRDSYLDKSPVPSLYNPCLYPKNLTLSNLVYFWWAPTLVYQPVYPRTDKIRVGFVAKRLLEMVLVCVLIWFLTSQYATPILENSLVQFQEKNFLKIAERLLKLSTVSIVIWLFGFFLVFHSYLNLLAELLRFADRGFYEDFWNCGSVGAYWKMWNKPIHNYFLRHLYVPLLKRGWTNSSASAIVFLLSALLHEVVVGIPTHRIIGVAFLCMLLQVPLVVATAPLEKMGHQGKTIGNCIFWLSFFLGQPTAVLLYYFAWNLKYGSLAQR